MQVNVHVLNLFVTSLNHLVCIFRTEKYQCVKDTIESSNTITMGFLALQIHFTANPIYNCCRKQISDFGKKKSFTKKINTKSNELESPLGTHTKKEKQPTK